MDRQLAKSYVGKKVILNEGKNGQYIGLLEDIQTEPRKIWVGTLRILGLYSFPEIDLDSNQLSSPLYSENEKVFCSGNKIDLFNQNFTFSYKESIDFALKNKWNEINAQKEEAESTLTMIQQELKRRKAVHLLNEDIFVYYSLVKKNRRFYVYDEEKQEALSLDGCPFEFEINIKDHWEKAHVVNEATFELEDGNQFELQHGDRLRLNKSQFDPYRILLNELEGPALQALERGLQQLGIFHEHNVYCHNTLLIQLLSSVEKYAFDGVNFLSYATDNQQFSVQHHYEREIQEGDHDITYDRFEFTADTGERLITTYATQFSKD